MRRTSMTKLLLQSTCLSIACGISSSSSSLVLLSQQKKNELEHGPRCIQERMREGASLRLLPSGSSALFRRHTCLLIAFTP